MRSFANYENSINRQPSPSPATTPHLGLDSGSRWAIILAGGEGTRLQPFVTRWLGRPIPKQFCAFSGSRTMLEHTIDRARRLVRPEQIVTILSSGQERFLTNPLPGQVLVQPLSRGTGAGIHLGLTYIRSVDPEASVLILPSDHFIHPESRFLESADFALNLSRKYPQKMVLVGIRSREPEPEYGWVSTAPQRLQPGVLPDGVHQVRRFVEKPSPHSARLFHQAGWYWNTMICAAPVRLLFECFAMTQSHLSAAFHRLESRLIEARRARLQPSMITLYLNECFNRLETSDFSAHLVSRLAPRILLLNMQGVDWDDWGRPLRIVQSLERIGRRPNFPVELADESLCTTPLSQAAFGPPREGEAA